jgi:FkbM family methyltransferase
MTSPVGQSFRTKTLPERIAAALPAGGALARLRQRLRPLFDLVLAHGREGFRSVLPGGEVVLIAPKFRHITWNADEYQAFRTAVRPGQTILEAGANVGAYTVLFGQWVGDSGRVVAFEPDPIAFDGLERHVTMNQLSTRTTLVPAAISDGTQERLRFALSPSSGISRLVPASEPDGPNIRDVRARSIDSFCAQHRLRPDLIKIDVEGAELAALRGARATIAAAGPDLHLFVEMHPRLWPAFGLSAEDVRRECEEQHLAAERLDGSHEKIWTTEGVCLRLRRIRP